MLQIITGRFFTADEIHRTRQRTVLYTNYQAHAPIKTIVGNYLPAGSAYDVYHAVYDVEQCLEAVRPDGSPSVLVAVAPEHLAEDFAALVSFCLNVTCSLDGALVRRLTQSVRPPIGMSDRPACLVDRVFGQNVLHSPQDAESTLSDFIADLVRLERSRYVRVMRAIRRYVVGLHRIGDDLPLAYTLLVASIESLAQRFDRFQPQWKDLDAKKRKRLNGALEEASSKTKDAVREAVLDVEHVALGRRYREFALDHVPPAYYREEALGYEGPARASELSGALRQAYSFRSQLVHELKELPLPLTSTPPPQDILIIDRKPALTFRGLARLARRVIMRFVELSPKSECEDYDYRNDLPGVFTAQLAPRYWIWRRENYHSRNARRFLSGFLSELEAVLLGRETGLTDISDVLKEVEQRAAGLSPNGRLPMLALYLLYHRILPQEGRRPHSEKFLARHISDFDSPSIESMVCHVILRESLDWKPDEQENIRKEYIKQRNHKFGLRLGHILEAAMGITSAEAYRAVGEVNQALEILGEAVENLPGHAGLLELEHEWQAGTFREAEWWELLLPKRERPSGKKNEAVAP